MTPTQDIIAKAVTQATSSFTKEVMECTKINAKSFVVSVVNVRGGYEILIDYTFATNNGRLINTKTIDQKYIGV